MANGMLPAAVFAVMYSQSRRVVPPTAYRPTQSLAVGALMLLHATVTSPPRTTGAPLTVTAARSVTSETVVDPTFDDDGSKTSVWVPATASVGNGSTWVPDAIVADVPSCTPLGS